MTLKNSELEATLCVIPPETPLEGFASLSVPVYRGSTIVFPNAAEYRARAGRLPDGYSYGLSGTPTTRTLEAQIASLHGAERAIIVPSGQAAISIPFLSILKQGDHLLIADNVYPPVKKFASSVLEPLGIEAQYFEATDLEDLDAKLRPGRTAITWIESPGSTTMEICDIPAIAERCLKAGALLGCDNTWATGLLCKPLELGVDFVAEALTKYAGGHSDILLGAVIFREMELYRQIRGTLSAMGIGVSPDDCSLALRGLQTMSLRLSHVGRVSEELAKRIEEQSQHRVLHPCLPSFSGHALWKRDFKGSAGVFAIQLDGGAEASIDRALDALRIFAIGASWGGTRSVIAPMTVVGDRHVTQASASRSYLRLSIGLESADDIWGDLKRALQQLSA